MNWKKKRLKNCRLYVILDYGILGGARLRAAAKAVKKSRSADIVQLRCKSKPQKTVLALAGAVKKIFSGTKTLFIINDSAQIALAVSSDGLHIGQSDIPLKHARAILGKDKIIGVSCHSLAQANRAKRQGADYIGIGPMFKTETKPGARPIGIKTIDRLKRNFGIPVFAIGGINQSTLPLLVNRGVKRVAVAGALCRAPDKLKAIKTIRGLL